MRTVWMAWGVAVGLVGAITAGCGGDKDGPVTCSGAGIGDGSGGGITPDPGCGGEDGPDPIGAWLINVQWLGGDCGRTGQSQITVNVALAGERPTLYPVTPPGQVDGDAFVFCSATSCEAQATIIENSGTVAWTMRLYSDHDRVISGDGTFEDFTDLQNSCMQQWRATGTIQ